MNVLHTLACLGFGQAPHAGYVTARGEHTAHAPDHKGSGDAIVLQFTKPLGQLLAHIEVDGVALVRAVDQQSGHMWCRAIH